MSDTISFALAPALMTFVMFGRMGKQLPFGRYLSQYHVVGSSFVVCFVWQDLNLNQEVIIIILQVLLHLRMLC